MEYEPKKSASKLEEHIINKILLKGDLGGIAEDLLRNTLTSKDNKMSPGMRIEDFDLIFSTYEAIDKEIKWFSRPIIFIIISWITFFIIWNTS